MEGVASLRGRHVLLKRRVPVTSSPCVTSETAKPQLEQTSTQETGKPDLHVHVWVPKMHFLRQLRTRSIKPCPKLLPTVLLLTCEEWITTLFLGWGLIQQALRSFRNTNMNSCWQLTEVSSFYTLLNSCVLTFKRKRTSDRFCKFFSVFFCSKVLLVALLRTDWLAMTPDSLLVAGKVNIIHATQQWWNLTFATTKIWNW